MQAFPDAVYNEVNSKKEVYSDGYAQNYKL